MVGRGWWLLLCNITCSARIIMGKLKFLTKIILKWKWTRINWGKDWRTAWDWKISSNENVETNEASQGNEESNSDSGSQSELILSEVDNPGEGTTNISEEIYKCSDGQVNKAVKYSR